MNYLEVSILITDVILNFILLGVVYTRNSRSATHRLFILQVLAINFYLVANYFAVNATNQMVALWAIRFVMFFAAPMSAVFFFLMHTFPNSTLSMTARAKWTWIFLTIVAMVSALSPYLFSSVVLEAGSVPQPVPGFGMLLFIPAGLITIPLGLYYLIRKTIQARGIKRIQFQFILLGVGLMFTLIISLIFIGTVIFKNSLFAQFAPIFTLPFVALTSYTIIRYRLMDIRAAIARSVSFSILLGSFALLYAGVLVFAVPVLTKLTGIQNSIISAIGALFAVLVARYIRDLLSRVTDRYLYQRQRDYRAAIVRISEELSGTIKIQDVTRAIIEASKNVIRSKKIIILLRDEAGKKYIPIAKYGANRFEATIAHNHSLPQYLSHISGALLKDEINILIEEATSEIHARQLQEVSDSLTWLDTPLILPLFVNKELTGMIVLGEKLSGEPYLKDDLEFLGALTPQAAVTLENARLYEESLEFGKKLELEVKQATHELEVANSQLRDLDKAKSEFLSVASHQLNTPLTPLRGYLSMMLEGEYGKIPPKQKPILQALEKSSVRLVDLIKNYLDISRIESGRLELNLESTNLVELAEALTKDLLPNAIEKNIKLEFIKSKKITPKVVADRERVRQVVLNFIDNAIKYTDSGRVTVSVKQEGAEIVFAVGDTGRGLSQSEIAKLFTKFTRVGGRQRFQAEGTGLGLYVAKQIIGEHNGRVEVTSPGPGHGSTFAMRLPIEGSARSLIAGEKATIEIKASNTGDEADSETTKSAE